MYNVISINIMSEENLSFPYALVFTGDQEFEQITLSGDITKDEHGINKKYIDERQSKKSVRFVNTSSFPTNDYTPSGSKVGKTLTGTGIMPNIFDGGTPIKDDRLLIIIENIHNGIYVVSGVGSAVVLTRTSDLTTSDNAASAYAFVGEGTLNGDKGFVCTSTSPNDVVGTDNIEFTAFSSSSQVIDGAGLSKPGQTISVNVDGSSIIINNDDNLEVGQISADVITTGSININRLPQSIQNLTTN